MEAANGPEAHRPSRPDDARRAGEASAFRRALDAQAHGDEASTALVPSGLHDLTAPISAEAIRAALGEPEQSGGTQPSSTRPDATADAATGPADPAGSGFFAGKVAASPTAPNRGMTRNPLAVGPLSGPVAPPGPAAAEPSLFGPWRGEGKAPAQNPSPQAQTQPGPQSPATPHPGPTAAQPGPHIPGAAPQEQQQPAAPSAQTLQTTQTQMPPGAFGAGPGFGPGQQPGATPGAPAAPRNPLFQNLQPPAAQPESAQQSFGTSPAAGAPSAYQGLPASSLPVPSPPFEGGRPFDAAAFLGGSAQAAQRGPATNGPAPTTQPFETGQPSPAATAQPAATAWVPQQFTGTPGETQHPTPFFQAPPQAQQAGLAAPGSAGQAGAVDTTAVLRDTGSLAAAGVAAGPATTAFTGASAGSGTAVERLPAAPATIPPARNLPAERKLPVKRGFGRDLTRRGAALPATPGEVHESGPRHGGRRGKAPRLGITVGVCVALAAVAAYALVQLGGGEPAPPLGTAGLPSYAIPVAGGATASGSPSGAASRSASASPSASASASPSASASASPSASASSSPSASASPSAPAYTVSDLVQADDAPYSVGQSGPGITGIQQQLVAYRLLSLNNGVYSVTRNTQAALRWLGEPSSPPPDSAGYYGTATDDAIKAFEIEYLRDYNPPSTGCSVSTYNALLHG